MKAFIGAGRARSGDDAVATWLAVGLEAALEAIARSGVVHLVLRAHPLISALPHISLDQSYKAMFDVDRAGVALSVPGLLPAHDWVTVTHNCPHTSILRSSSVANLSSLGLFTSWVSC